MPWHDPVFILKDIIYLQKKYKNPCSVSAILGGHAHNAGVFSKKI